MNIKSLLILVFLIACKGNSQENDLEVSFRTFHDYFLTHQLTPFGPVPTALDPNGIYPYVSYAETSNRPELKEYEFVVIQNDNIEVIISPDLGGKVLSLTHKPSKKNVLYTPKVIRGTRILPRFYFVAGGIEVSFPVSHTPVQNETVKYKVEKRDGRIYVTCGEKELRYGMQWSVEYSLGSEDDFLTQRVKYHNPGREASPWMSWSNAAIPSAPDTEFHFPKGKVLSHSSVLDTLSWNKEGPQTESEIHEMTGYFWQTKDVNAFGAFTPSMGTGLYHIAEANITPGIKLWSYGVGKDSIWSQLSTAKPQSYVEIQGGPIMDQSIKNELRPGETKFHVEYWFPTDKPLDIYTLKLPDNKLRPVSEIPLFDWARKQEVEVWKKLKKAAKGKTKLPIPPGIHEMVWPPSGMRNLRPAFEYAIKNSSERNADLWRLYLGTWLTAKEDLDAAQRVLEKTQHDLGKPLLARLLKRKGENEAAVKVILDIKEPWLQLHPQIVVQRDILLREGSSKNIDLRARWLEKVSALPDEWIVERRIQLLIDQGELEKAKELFLKTPFQHVHQSYSRTYLWKQICVKLDGCEKLPNNIGEDNLARFGAYREYE